MDIRTARQELFHALKTIYPIREASLIADMVVEHVTGFSRSERLIHGHEQLTIPQRTMMDRCQQELLQWRPVQYVIGEAWFHGLRLHVDERVLIPRPETEELVDWCLAALPRKDVRILDAGTGSGCIALALSKALPEAEVWAADKSLDALALAAVNAQRTGIRIQTIEWDILDTTTWASMPYFDIVVSNPPYVLSNDRDAMRDNVLRYEPYLALFVEGPDPLLFYNALSAFCLQRLFAGGQLFLEINEAKGPEVAALCEGMGFRSVSLRQDASGRDRMVRAERP